MKKIGFLIFISLFWIFTSCNQSDIDELRNDLNDQASRLSVLEAWQQQLNSNITTLQDLLNAQQQRKSILSVTSLAEGYKIKLSDGTELLIRHGEKGEAGETGNVATPVLGVRDSSDGNYYWTVNGELLKNASGNAVRANGEKGDKGEPGGNQGDKGEVGDKGEQGDKGEAGDKGEQGDKGETGDKGDKGEPGDKGETGDKGEQGDKGDKGDKGDAGDAGIAPKLRINDTTNEWEISVDGGENWESTGVQATGAKGDKGDAGGGVFATENGVVIGRDKVTFKLADGSSFNLPLYRPLSLSLDESEPYGAGIGQKLQIGFTINGTLPSNVEVYAAGNAGWDASAELTNASQGKGVLYLTAPAQCGKSQVLVFLSDGAGQTWTYGVTVTTFPVDMIHIAGGSLKIIGNLGNDWSVSSYLLSRTEVTNQQFCNFLNAMSPIPETCNANSVKTDGKRWFSEDAQIEYDNGRWHPKTGAVLGAAGLVSFADYPMTYVSWYGAKAFCDWSGGSLPTEAQWEYAARGGEENTTGYNLTYAGSNTIGEVAWYQSNSPVTPQSVAQKTANYLGLYDMSGNVQEWCNDWWVQDAQYPSNGLNGTKADPQGAGTTNYKVVRGGGWSDIAAFCAVGHRYNTWPNILDPALGFRIAFTLAH